FYTVGMRDESKGIVHPHHHPKFDIQEEVLIDGVNIYANLVPGLLNGEKGKDLMKQKKFEMPHVFVVLMSVLLVIYFLTFLIPNGEYDRVDTEAGHMSIVSGSFNYIVHENVSFFDLVQAIPRGMAQGGELIFGGLMIAALYK